MALTDEKRKQILDAAVGEFQERGFSGASMDRIAARANVSKRTVYNHFDSKEALFRAILDLMAEAVDLAFVVSFQPDKPIEEQLYDLGWAEGRLMTAPDFMRLARMVVGETMRDPVLAAEWNARMEMVEMFRSFFSAANSAGALVIDDPEVVAGQFLGLIKSRSFWPVIFTAEPVSREEMDVIIRDTVDVMVKTYGPGTS